MTRRDDLTIRAMVVKTIRPDTVFIPYHWAGTRSANRLTHRTLDPRSKIPEFKVSACRIKLAAKPDTSADDRPAHRNGASQG
jgi:assimilatory nitrate reductase catalytic subunit